MSSAVTLVCSLFFCLLLADASPRHDKVDPFLDQLRDSQKQCYDYFKSSCKKALAKSLEKLKVGEEESNGQSKCFITCLLKKTGVVKGDGTEFDVKPVLAKLKNPADKDAVTAAVDTCKAEAAKGSACDNGYIFIDCVFKRVTEGADDAEDDAEDE